MKIILWLAVSLICFATCAVAQNAPNCDNQMDQSTMTQCAGLDFEKVDAELNAAWPEIKAAAVESDQAAGDGSKDYEKALLASQRAWIAFRDAECIWQGFSAHNGSMEPMLVSMCAAKLTRERIKQLQEEPQE